MFGENFVQSLFEFERHVAVAQGEKNAHRRPPQRHQTLLGLLAFAELGVIQLFHERGDPLGQVGLAVRM